MELFKEQEDTEISIEELTMEKVNSQISTNDYTELKRYMYKIRQEKNPSRYMEDASMCFLKVLGFSLSDWNDFVVRLI